MARSKSRPSHTPDSLDEFESRGERVLQWVADNARIVLGTAAAVLAIAAAWGFSHSADRERQLAAADALAQARESYLAAMGASPGAIEVPELANPAAAANIRSEFIDRFRAVGEAHPDTRAGGFARLEEGNLAAADGNAAAALEIWRNATAELPAEWPVTAMLQRRIGQAREADGEWIPAAEAYEAAAAVPDFTFRPWALADAARCYAAAGQPDRAVGLLDQIEAETPNLALPEYLTIQFREIRASQSR